MLPEFVYLFCVKPLIASRGNCANNFFCIFIYYHYFANMWYETNKFNAKIDVKKISRNLQLFNKNDKIYERIIIY